MRQVIGRGSTPDNDRFALIGETKVGIENTYVFAASQQLTAAEAIDALRTEGASAAEADRLLAEARAAFARFLPAL